MMKLFYLNTDVEIKIKDQIKNTSLVFCGFFKDLFNPDFHLPIQYKKALYVYDLMENQYKIYLPLFLNLEIREV